MHGPPAITCGVEDSRDLAQGRNGKSGGSEGFKMIRQKSCGFDALSELSQAAVLQVWPERSSHRVQA
jgi:hypothetical protein